MEENNTQNNPISAPEAQLPPGHNKAMAILAYLSVLVIVSYLTAKDDSFVKFHIKQGLVLLVIHVAVWILAMMMAGLYFYPLMMIANLIYLAVVVLSVLGIVNVVNDQEKPLPLVGGLAKYFNI